MKLEFLHDLSFAALYLLLFISLYVFIEKLLYLRGSGREGFYLQPTDTPSVGQKSSAFQREIFELLDKAVQSRPDDLGAQTRWADWTENSFQKIMHRGVWLVSSITSLSPLLGLLGTILGIIDTFHVLASQGVSDPQMVSRGIGDALFATALGIFIAAVSLVFHNALEKIFETRLIHFQYALLQR